MRTEHWVTSYHVPTCLPPRKSNKIVLGNFPSARSNCSKLIGPYEMLLHFPSSLCLIISRITEPTPLPLLPRDSVHPSRIKRDHACLLTLALGHLGSKLRQVYWIWISIAENALFPLATLSELFGACSPHRVQTSSRLLRTSDENSCLEYGSI